MKVAETGGSGTSSSYLFPCAGGDLQQQQKRNNQLILVFIFFVFGICFSFSFSPFRICSFLPIGSFPFVSPFLFQVVGCMNKGGPTAARLLSGLAAGDGEEICYRPRRLKLLWRWETEGVKATDGTAGRRCWLKKAGSSGG
jgi:hypothetical protein